MRIIFFGSSDFSIPVLDHLIRSKHQTIMVVTVPDRKKGRGQTLSSSTIHQYVQKFDLPTLSPEDLKNKKVEEKLRFAEPDFFVVASYGMILPDNLISIPKKLPLNVHPSLLPKYRGASPIPASILNDDKQTGVSIAEVTARLDAGDLILQEKMLIDPSEDAITLETKLAHLGGELICQCLDAIEANQYQKVRQKDDVASYAAKIRKEQGRIDWQQSARGIHNQIRAYIKWPGSYSSLSGKRILILKSRLTAQTNETSKPGVVTQISSQGFMEIQTGSGRLQINLIQPESLRPMTPYAYSLGRKIKEGDLLI